MIVIYGVGIGSVARRTVPLAPFDPDRYPVLMGRLALPLLAAMAAAPYVEGLVFEKLDVDDHDPVHCCAAGEKSQYGNIHAAAATRTTDATVVQTG